MELLTNLMAGASVVAQPSVLFYCLLGVTLGTLIGVLPGIGPLTGISLLLPLSFQLDPTSAVILLAGIYYVRAQPQPGGADGRHPGRGRAR